MTRLSCHAAAFHDFRLCTRRRRPLVPSSLVKVTRRKQHRPGIAPNANTTHVPTTGSSVAPTKPNHTPTRHPRAKGKLVKVCKGRNVKRLEMQQVAEIRTARTSGPFRHVHIDLAGPFALRQVKAEPVKGRAGRTKATLSTERTGQAFICLMVDNITKPAEFAPIPDKSAVTVARVVHDYWFMRYGMPEWVTTDVCWCLPASVRAFWYRPCPNLYVSSAVQRCSRAPRAHKKDMLAAKIAGATHDWAALLP